MRYLRNWLPIYNDGGEGSSGNPPPNPPPTPKTFTQEEVNAFLAKEKKATQAKLEQTTKQLSELQKNQSLTQAERDEIAANLERLQNESLTKEELAAKELKKLKDQFEINSKTLAEERDLWKNQYSNTTITNSLTTAAVKAEAISTEQINRLLQTSSKVVPVLGDDGKAKPNQFKVVVVWPDVDKSGNPITLELSPEEVLKRMKEDVANYGNLFKGTAVGGTGTIGGTFSPNGKIDVSKVKDHQEYMRIRAQLKKEGKL